jgi:hypothetical protein
MANAAAGIKPKSKYGKKRSVKRRFNKKRGVVRPRKFQATGGVATQSVVSSTIRPSAMVRGLTKITVPNTWLTQRTDNTVGAFGFQTQGQFIHNSVADLRQMANQNGSTLPYVGAGAALNLPTRFILESLVSEITYTNQASSAVDLEIYDIVCKRDIPIANNITVGVNTYVLAPTPIDYWTQGVDATRQLVLPSPQTSTYMGSSPYDSPFFKDYFKVIRRQIVHLPQGANHRHVNILRPNKLCTNDTWANINTIAVAGLTSFTMINVKGYPVSCAGPPSPTTTSLVSIQAVQSLRYKYTWVQNNSYQSFYNSQLFTPTTASVMNIGSGTPLPVTTA